jgi:amino acid permease
MMFPARLSLWSLWCHIARKPSAKETFWTRFSMVLVCCWFCYFVAVAVDNISVIFGFVGATMGSLLIFIMPALLTLRLDYLLTRRASATLRENLLEWWNWRRCLPPLALLLAGTFFGVAGVVALI